MNEDCVNICQTCLSCDRLLVPMIKFQTLLKDLNVSLNINHQTGRICWECKAIITKFSRFKNQALEAQKLLEFYMKGPSLSSLKTTVNNTYNYIFNYEENNEMEVKEDIKSEIKTVNPDLMKDNIKTIIFNESDMLMSREMKRNQPNFKKIPFKCDSCVLGFTKLDKYDLHVKEKHHESLGQYSCPVCLSRFPTSKAMLRHKNKHYIIHKCILCGYDSLNMTAAVKHCIKKHKGDKYGVIHCRQCEDVFSTPDELSDHMKVKHILYCNQCGQKFKGKHTLRTHIMRIHSENRNYICDICTKTFKTKSRLESHITSHNSSLAKKLSYCTICKVQYKNIYVYRNHLKNSKNHSGRQYHCKDCNKKFASKVYFKKHCDFFHLKKSSFKCETCNKIFISDWRLKNHKQKHHGMLRTRDHTCNICGKKFYTQSTLRDHELTHSEERTYMCSDCGDTFKQRPALYTHCKLVHKDFK